MLSRRQFNRVRDVPVEPGTTPVAPGNIRMYHYTRSLASLNSIRQGGIRFEHAQGEQSYGEPNAVWGSTQRPGHGQAYVEAHIPHAQFEPGSVGLPEKGAPQSRLDEFNAGNHNFAMVHDVGHEHIVTHQDPVIRHLRYIQGERDYVKNDLIPSGGMNWMLQSRQYDEGEHKMATSLIPQFGRTTRYSKGIV